MGIEQLRHARHDFHISHTIINMITQTEVKLCVKNILLFSAPAAVPHIIDAVTHHLNR